MLFRPLLAVGQKLPSARGLLGLGETDPLLTEPAPPPAPGPGWGAGCSLWGIRITGEGHSLSAGIATFVTCRWEPAVSRVP